MFSNKITNNVFGYQNTMFAARLLFSGHPPHCLYEELCSNGGVEKQQ
jgi:hypothetical protein